MFYDDIVTILVTAKVGVAGANAAGGIFVSSKAAIPTGAGPYLSISETGGSSPEDTHNAARYSSMPAYVRPNAQILVRASSYSVARTMAEAAYSALYSIQNQFINGVWWRETTMLQEPFDFGLDDLNRACVVFNMSAVKRPNAAMSR
jgi:hypothetical protein